MTHRSNLHDPSVSNTKSSLDLVAEHRNLLVDLVLLLNQFPDDLSHRVATTPGMVEKLAEAMTRVLADRDYRDAWTALLLKLNPDLSAAPLVNESDVRTVLGHGPAKLCAESLVLLALSPSQTEFLHEVIAEELSDFWVDAVESAMQSSARERGIHRKSTAELFEQIKQQIRSLQPESMDQDAETMDCENNPPFTVTGFPPGASNKPDKEFSTDERLIDVLVVDDEELNLNALARALEYHNLNWRIRTASSSKLARSLLREQSATGRYFQVLLTDLILEADQTGFDVLSEALKSNSGLIAVLFTANEHRLNRDEAKHAGFISVVAKNDPDRNPAEQLSAIVGESLTGR